MRLLQGIFSKTQWEKVFEVNCNHSAPSFSLELFLEPFVCCWDVPNECDSWSNLCSLKNLRPLELIDGGPRGCKCFQAFFVTQFYENVFNGINKKLSDQYQILEQNNPATICQENWNDVLDKSTYEIWIESKALVSALQNRFIAAWDNILIEMKLNHRVGILTNVLRQDGVGK